jgi:hypothetical protein
MKKLKFYLGYAFYVLLTVEERRNYIQAEQKGYDCTHSYDDSYLLRGSATVFHFDKSKPPKKHYLTYEQYKKLYYPKK